MVYLNHELGNIHVTMEHEIIRLAVKDAYLPFLDIRYFIRAQCFIGTLFCIFGFWEYIDGLSKIIWGITIASKEILRPFFFITNINVYKGYYMCFNGLL